MSRLDELNGFVEVDREKTRLLDGLVQNRLSNLKRLEAPNLNQELRNDISFNEDVDNYCLMESPLPEAKICPKCGRRFEGEENFCPDCLVTLKRISEEADIKGLKTNPAISFKGKSDCLDILNQECLSLIDDFDFTINEFYEILFSIKSQAFENMDSLIKEYSINLDNLDILDKVMLFAKSFVRVEYKFYGETLGYFEADTIHVDDRQIDSLQITTIIHELTHFLVKEILTGILCRILDSNKNKHIESAVTYILNYSELNRLIDEYAAHSVEGRFTVFGYQDYSSFIALQGDLDKEYVEMAKTIGNTFSIHIKNLLEGFLDWDVRSQIKERFLSETIEQPNYAQLRFENCNKLTDEGFIKAIGLILSEIENADGEKLMEIEQEF